VQKIILYIQPQLRNTTTAQDFVRVDLMEEDLIELTQVIQDARDIEKIFTDYSKTFNLPASKTNNKIFKHWYNPDIDGFDNQIFSSARIELNHLHFKFGKIKLEEAVLRNGEISMYKVIFFGDTLTLTELIGQDSLDSLLWLNNFNHLASNSYIKDGLENGKNFTVSGVTYNDAIIYPLIAHSQSYIYDFTNNLDNGLNISTASSHHNRRGVFPEDLKPAITAKIIFKAIEQQYGITFKTSEFLDSSAMTNLYMWLHREKGKLVAPNSKELKTLFTCTSNTTVCNHFSSSQPPIGPQSTGGSYIFSDNNTGGQPEGFTFEAQILPTDNTIEYAIDIINENDGITYATLEGVTGTQSLSVGFGFSTTNPITQGQAFTLIAKVRSATSLTFDSVLTCQHFVFNTNTFTYDTYSGTFTQDANLTTDQTITIRNQVPDIKVIDFLRAFFNMHNLTAFLNFNGEVVVKTLDSFYAGGDTQDITQFVKTDEHTVGATVPFSEIDFEYADPESILAQQFLNTNNIKYGELNYLADTTKSKNYKIKIPFEHMIFERLQDKTSNALTTVQIGSFLDDNLEPNIGQPLLFYGIYQEDVDAINFIYNTRPAIYGALADNPSSASRPTEIFELESYWIPSVCNELGTSSTPPTYNLNFGSEINTYTLTDYAGNNNSLFQTYYQNYITRVFNKRTRIFKFSAVLPLKVLLTLTLDDLIVVGTRAYTINKMSTKLQSGETSFELLNEPT
jgi:hypothetical protein